MKQRSNSGALLPRAGLAPGVHFFPEFARIRQPAQFRAVARFRAFPPIRAAWGTARLRPALQYRLFFNVVELLPAEIILPPFHQGDAHLREHFLEKRDVLVEELLLEVLGARGDDGAQTAAQQGHKVRQRFARAGARLHNQVLAVFDRRLHALRHFELSRPVLVIRMVPRQPPAGCEDFVERNFIRCLGIHGSHIGKLAIHYDSP